MRMASNSCWLLVATFVLRLPGQGWAAVSDELEKPLRILRNGYASQDTRPLDGFLRQWHSQVKPVSKETFKKKPPVEREVYAIFRAFFDPPIEYRGTKYVIIQNNLELILVDDDMTNIFAKMGHFERGPHPLDDVVGPADRVYALPVISRMRLRDFRPPVDVKGADTLYLDRNHLEILLFFLTGRQEYSLVDRYGDEDNTKPSVENRLKYLNCLLHIIPGHWGAGWHFETHPFAYRVYLSSNRKNAVVEFRRGYGGGEVYLKLEKDGWKVLLRDENWVE